jgi:predicted GTPase
MKSKGLSVLIVTMAMLVALPALADKKTEKNDEDALKTTIEHLLEFVRSSDVVFIRNGKEHKPEDAAKHIEKKYKHYRKKIKTPEDFIEKSATKSMMSGKLYQVRLKDGTLIATRDWLLEELERFRAGGAEAEPDTIGEAEGCEDVSG